MAEHKQEIDAFGAKDDFWLFGYGYLNFTFIHCCKGT
jgi:hypothetical protein